MLEAQFSERSRIVVIGTSLAGLRAVEALRRRGYPGSIVWIGEESHAPYDRPPLSKQLLLGTFEPEQLTFRRKQGYEALNVDMRLGLRAVALDRNDDRLRLSDGSHLDFDGLVIATGARARLLTNPAPAHGVFSLRTLGDGLALRRALEGKPRHVAVVGAGFIGLEAASVCRALDIPVTVIEQATLPLARVIGEGMAQAILRLHQTNGTTMHLGRGVRGLLGGSQLEGVQLDDGEIIQADLTILGLGVVPNVEWLADSGIALDNGVACDARCATSRANVVACGDVARFRNERFGIDQRVEHWTHAVEMAAAAVDRLLDGPDVPPFSPVPYFWSDQYNIKIQFAGYAVDADEYLVTEGSEDSGKLVALYGRAGRLTAVLSWNSPARLIRFRRAIAEGVSLDEARAL